MRMAPPQNRKAGTGPGVRAAEGAAAPPGPLLCSQGPSRQGSDLWHQVWLGSKQSDFGFKPPFFVVVYLNLNLCYKCIFMG